MSGAQCVYQSYLGRVLDRGFDNQDYSCIDSGYQVRLVYRSPVGSPLSPLPALLRRAPRPTSRSFRPIADLYKPLPSLSLPHLVGGAASDVQHVAQHG